MRRWVAVGHGALDIRGRPESAGSFAYMVTPVVPSPPLMLHGQGAALWERLVERPVSASGLTAEDTEIVHEMAAMGLASDDVDHPARIISISHPWLTSPTHELVYALLARIAQQEGIPLVFIKGPTLQAQGLRSRLHSGDVDCWVPLGTEIRLARAMQAWGWQPALSAFTGTRVLHSLTLRSGAWGCAIDVHSWVPGMSAEPLNAFESVHSSAEVRVFASIPCLTPRRDLHAVISAVNHVRPWRGRRPGPEQIAESAAVLRTAGEATIPGAQKLGANFALADALRQAFPSHAFDFADAAIPPDWAWRLERSTLRVYVAALRVVPPKDRIRVLFRVLWPTAESLEAGPLGDRFPGLGAVNLRIRRTFIGMQQLLSKR